VRRYRPRIEGLCARIERWTEATTGVIHWRSISKDNITTFYGKDNNSRIFDPADPDPQHPTRIFSWLICQTYDDKGNAIVYEYADENERGVDLSQTNERNRMRTANRYLKRIFYGNRQPLLLDTSKDSFRRLHTEVIDFSLISWMFEVVFDYDEDHYRMLSLLDPPRSKTSALLSVPTVSPFEAIKADTLRNIAERRVPGQNLRGPPANRGSGFL
jgi:hypothetical protein